MGSIRQQVEARKKARRAASDEDRFAVDKLLRECGFTVLSRLRGKEAVWTRLGRRFPQWKALKTVPVAEVVRARSLERNYRERKYGRVLEEHEGI